MISQIEKEVTLRFLKTRKNDGFLNIISIFSFIGISLGVAVLIVVMSVMNGFRTELINKIVGFNAHAIVKPYQTPINSVLKPFITDITIISTATPKDIPINENIDIIFKKPSFFLVLRNLKVTSFSNCEINLI